MLSTRILLIALAVLAGFNTFSTLRRQGDRVYSSEKHFAMKMGFAGIAVASAAVWALNPDLFSFAQIHVSIAWLKWIGNILITAAVIFWIWSKRSLGENWSRHIAALITPSLPKDPTS